MPAARQRGVGVQIAAAGPPRRRGITTDHICGHRRGGSAGGGGTVGQVIQRISCRGAVGGDLIHSSRPGRCSAGGAAEDRVPDDLFHPGERDQQQHQADQRAPHRGTQFPRRPGHLQVLRRPRHPLRRPGRLTTSSRRILPAGGGIPSSQDLAGLQIAEPTRRRTIRGPTCTGGTGRGGTFRPVQAQHPPHQPDPAALRPTRSCGPGRVAAHPRCGRTAPRLLHRSRHCRRRSRVVLRQVGVRVAPPLLLLRHRRLHRDRVGADQVRISQRGGSREHDRRRRHSGFRHHAGRHRNCRRCRRHRKVLRAVTQVGVIHGGSAARAGPGLRRWNGECHDGTLTVNGADQAERVPAVADTVTVTTPTPVCTVRE